MHAVAGMFIDRFDCGNLLSEEAQSFWRLLHQLLLMCQIFVVMDWSELILVCLEVGRSGVNLVICLQ